MMIPTSINADTTDPVIIALRSKMKERFLSEFSRVDHTLEWDDAELVVYGSTLMHSMQKYENISFPLQYSKSSDIDIGVFQSGTNRLRAKYFEDAVKELVAPLVHSAVIKCKFDLELKNLGKPKQVPKDDIEELKSSFFIGDFFVAQSFNEQEVRSVLGDREDFFELEPFINEGITDVKLVLGVNEMPFPIMLNPKEVLSPAGDGEYNRCRALDMLAGKISRTMSSMRKPTDVIDIYRLLKAQRSDGSSVFNWDINDPENDIDVLRTLIVAYMPMSRGVDINSQRVSEIFEPTKENIDWFLEGFKKEVSVLKINQLEEEVVDILKSVNSTFREKIFRKKADLAYGPLNLTENEMRFFRHLDGVEFSAPKPEIKKTSSPLLKLSSLFQSLMGKSSNTRKQEFLHSRGNTSFQNNRINPKVSVELLKKESPKAFEKYPELYFNIRHNDILKDRVLDTLDRRVRMSMGPAFGE